MKYSPTVKGTERYCGNWIIFFFSSVYINAVED